MKRRNFLLGLLAAPSLVRASSLDYVPRALFREPVRFWQDLAMTIPARPGDPVAVALDMCFVNGKSVPLMQPTASRRPLCGGDHLIFDGVAGGFGASEMHVG